jgi:hypothetical protein
METKAANREDAKVFIDDQGRMWTVTSIEKEFWDWAFSLGEIAERLADAEDDETCEGYIEVTKCDDKGVDDVFNCH